MFYGRVNHINTLNEKYDMQRKQFGVIYGRNKIGKTETIKKFCEGKECVYYDAVQSNAYANLKVFSHEIAPLANLPQSYFFSDWQDALDTMSNYFKGRRYVFVIDDYPYVASQVSGFASILQSFYDRAADNLFFIIIGSDSEYMRRVVIDRSAPLYFRQTFEMPFEKLPLSEALLFLEGCGLDDKMNYLSLMSSYPYYLSKIDKRKSFEENVIDLFFGDIAPFANVSSELLSSVTDVPNVYNAILTSIAGGYTTIQDISRTTREPPTKISKYMIKLTESGIVCLSETFNGNTKSHYYVLEDPVARFWYRFVFPTKTKTKEEGKKLFESKKSYIYEYLVRGFADVAAMHVEELNANLKLIDLFPALKKYSVYSSRYGGFIRLDGLAKTGSSLLVFDCLTENYLYEEGRYEQIQKYVSAVFGDEINDMNCQYCIFSRKGFCCSPESNPSVMCFTPSDFLGSEKSESLDLSK